MNDGLAGVGNVDVWLLEGTRTRSPGEIRELLIGAVSAVVSLVEWVWNVRVPSAEGNSGCRKLMGGIRGLAALRGVRRGVRR